MNDQDPQGEEIGAAARELLRQGRHAEAEAVLKQVLSGRIDCARSWGDLALALMGRNRRNEAAAAATHAINLHSPDPAPYALMGGLFRTVGETDKAEAMFRRALELDPACADALSGLGAILAARGADDDLAPLIEAASERVRGQADAGYRLALDLDDAGLRDAAIPILAEVVDAAPHHAAARFLLGTLSAETGEPERALALYRTALPGVAADDRARVHDTILMTLHYVSGPSRDEIFAEHLTWAERYAPPAPPPPPVLPDSADPDRRLRVGLVSANFRHFAVAHFLLGVLEARPKGSWEVALYSGTRRPDDYTRAFEAAADLWRDTSGISDAEMAALIRADGIDLLFDLDGHTRGNRLGVFARKPAPVQVSWLDYVDTTGLAAMDYALWDDNQCPEGDERWFTERLHRLPGDYVCYRPPADCPEVAPLPAEATGAVTFGSFNNAIKISPKAIAVWAKILGRVPGSSLFLNTPELRHRTARARVESRFADHGIGAERLIFGQGAPHREFLEAYGRVDVALDTFPYSGGLTTCEALWMGVPVVTFAGDRMCSRHATAHLRTAGLGHLVAKDEDGYVETAVRLAGDIAGLAELRASLRGRVAASPLCDVSGFTANLDRAIREMWRNYVASSASN